MTDYHKRHELRQARHLRVVPQHSTVPAELDAEVPMEPRWMEPTPRRSRYSTPLIQHNSTGNRLREFWSIFRLYSRSHGVLYSLRRARDIALRGIPF